MQGMDFAVALRAAKQGRKVRHALWAPGVYAEVVDGVLIIRNVSFPDHEQIGHAELMSECWELYEA